MSRDHESKTKKSVKAGFSVRHIRLDAIEVPSNRRQLNEDKVNALDASVALLGLRTPITVRQKIDEKSGAKRYFVVAGAYRVEVANRRGWETIPSFVVRRRVKARLWREAENLYRAELNVLERAESIERFAPLLARGKLPPGGVNRMVRASTRPRSA
jgi:ParB/RepB/Spo0J family partition protein